MTSEGPGACSPGKFLTIYVLLWPLECFLNNFDANFYSLDPNFECFTKYDAFCLHSFDYARLRRLRHIAMKRFKIMEKIYSFKALLKIAGAEGASLTSPL